MYKVWNIKILINNQAKKSWSIIDTMKVDQFPKLQYIYYTIL